jgi:hypothetical protein
MSHKSLKFKLYKMRADFRRRRRLLFPSPAEVELIRIMGGKYISSTLLKDPKTKFPLTIITDIGTVFKRESIAREVRVGAMYTDFATVGLRYLKAIEVDGLAFHDDIVKEIKRDEYLKQRGWEIMHLQAASIYREPGMVQKRVLEFLAK